MAVGSYDPARVLSVWPVGGPLRVSGDPSGFARYDLDLELAWCPVVGY